MKVLFIGGILPHEDLKNIEVNTKGEIWYSADIHQKKMIRGLSDNGMDYHVFSAPLIGAYPMRYKKLMYHAPKSEDSHITYVDFLNIWGLRNFSRANKLKKVIRHYVRDIDDQIMVISYMAHQPFLDAACYVKKIRPTTKICYVVPDLPEYMNLNKRTFIYELAKKLDNYSINKLSQNVDSFAILTDFMKERLNIRNRKYTVVEGIIDPDKKVGVKRENHDTINIVYTGTLQARYGFRKLVEDFMRDSHKNYRLIICGGGESEEYLKEMSLKDTRIIFKGQVRPEEVWEIYKNADVLINPRENDSVYTKYSFPSKNIDYLLTGRPVVACMLDGMPEIYKNFIYEVNQGKYMEAIGRALSDTEHDKKSSAFYSYAKDNLTPREVIKRIVSVTI